MATKFQIKRTSISGRTPNTADPANSSFIAAGELAVNLIDEKVFSSNGSVSFEVGANLTSVAVANLVTVGNSTIKTTINSTSIAVTKIFANGVTGSAGQVLSANSTGGIYWETSAGGAGTLTVTSDTFNGNNSNTIFTLSTSSTTDRSFVYLNGVQQAPTTDYTISGTTLTFVVAPPSDNVIEVRSFDIPSIADITVTTDTFTANGTQTNFTLSTPDSSVTNSLVFLNGVTQVPTTDYTLSSTTLTFLSAPANNTAVQAISFTSAGVKSAAFTGNGSNTQFTLPVISTTSKTIVAINGVTQTPVTDYSVSGTTLIFAVAPVNNDNILVRVLPSKVDSAGGNTQIQYNKSGSLGGSAGFTFNDTTNNVTIGNTLIVPNFILNASNPPANSTATGNTGTFAWDSSFLYVAVGTNDWKKVAITTDGSGGGSANTAGSNTEVQFNDSGDLGASAGFTFNKDSNNLTVANTLTVVRLSANGSTGADKILAANSTGGIFWSDGGGYGVTRNEYTANGTAVNFTLSKQPFSEEHVLVFVDGVIQKDADISVSGTTLTFAVAPDNLSEIEAFVFQTGAATPGGSNTHIQYNDSGVMEGSAAFTFNEATNTVSLSNTLTIGSNVTVNTSTIFIGNSTVNTTIVAGNVDLQGTQLTVGNTVLTGQQITVGNSTVNSVIRANGATFTGDLMPSANVTYDIGNSAMRWRDLWLSGTTINLGGATIKTDTDTGAIAFVPKATADVPNPKAVVVSPRGGIQAVDTTDGVPIINNSITTIDGVLYGNSTVNTTINSSSVSTIVLNVGSNVFVNTSTIHLGNSTVNTVIHTTGFTGNGAGLHSVNAAALEGNTVANILTAANTAANTLANAAYSNAVAYAASNTRVNEIFDLKANLAGATFTGAIVVSNTASLGNTTINGFVNVSSNLTVQSISNFGNDVVITGNLIVTGTRIFANTTTVDLSDNIITLNADIGDTVPSENSGLEVNRGSSANVQFIWNETIDKWTFTTDGTNFVTVASNNDVDTAYSNAIGYSGNAALAYANATSYADSKAATAFSNAAARADSAYSNAIAYSANASNISSGTVAFARLPALYLGTTQIQSTSAAQAVSGITTLAAGNTTITGFANVTTTLQVGTNTATFGTAVYVVANGNVGIGTASPDAPLTFAGAVGEKISLYQTGNNFRFGLSVAAAAATSFWTRLYAPNYGDGGVQIGAVNSSTAAFESAITVLGTGNVGIGTTAPTAPLTLVTPGGTTDGTYFSTFTIRKTTNNAAAGIRFDINDTALFRVGTFSGNNSFQISRLTGTGAPDDGNFWISSANGNVGISNSAPAGKLVIGHNSDVSGFQTALTNPAIQIENSNAAGQSVIAFSFGGTVRSTIRGDFVGNLILSPKSGGMYYGFDSSGANTVEHRFYSNSSTVAVLFASNNNVGIGTTTPINKLQVVNGTIGVSDGAATNRGRFFWTTSGFTGVGLYNDDNSSLVFGTNATARVEIDVSGNMLPFVNSTYNLGSSTKRWATVFTSDLDLSNGIGDWTIVEGEDDLFIYNNKRGKVYKFKLEEVDPSTATPKKENL